MSEVEDNTVRCCGAGEGSDTYGIDLAGNGGMASIAGTTYITGGAGTPPEID